MHSIVVQYYCILWYNYIRNENVIVIILAIYMCIQDGFNAVHLAASGGHVSLVRELVDIHHANVHQRTKVFYSSLVSS